MLVRLYVRPIQKFHENREFSKAIKKADDILGNYPDHSETMSIKALCLNSLKKKDEAYALIKLAISKNITNFSVWHSYGLISQNDRQFMYSNLGIMNLQEDLINLL